MTKYIKILAYSLFLAVAAQPANGTEKIYKLWYTAPAANDGGVFEKDWSDRPTDADWERYSLPIGNGYMGASVFGRTDSERILLSDKTLHIRGLWGTETNTAFANVYLDFFHNNRKDYERSLTLNDGIQRVQYSYQGTTYKRTYFASYPDKIIAIKLTADQAASITFNLRIQIPYLVPFGALQRPDSITKGYLSGPTQTRFSGNGRTGRVVAESNDILSMRGETEYLKMIYEGRIKVIPYGGSIHANRTDDGNDWLHVEKADSAVILLTTGTNYKLQTSVFEGAPAGRLKNQADPHDEVVRTIEKASALGYEQLLERHSADYRQFFDRVKIDLGEALPVLPTDKLLKDYKEGKNSNYLEELMFQYGRYLLICSSRKGTLPPLLQGVWNQYELAPWNNNYTHNINIQMNYWPVFSTNLAELFESYVDYYKAYRPKAEQIASAYIRKHHPDAYSSKPGDNGWVIGAGAGPFFIGQPGGHSGPGTGGMTAKLFADYYYFTADDDILKEISYPAIAGMAQFFCKTLTDTLGHMLAYPSSSPEQFSKLTGKPYPTVGCAFDQQMIYETFNDVLKTSRILHRSNALTRRIKKLMPQLDPVIVGKSGQVKEYREEEYYDDIVLETNHRHISNLIGLYPGTLINHQSPQWIDAAQTTLNLRGDASTGWSMAHKLNLWARTGNGERAHQVLETLLKTAVADNLWTNCIAVLRSPFQIDANFGTTAGIAEMLLQSHEAYISPLPALPDNWQTGSYEGLVARGNFEISVQWKDKRITQLQIRSRKGMPCRIKLPDGGTLQLTDSKRHEVAYRLEEGNIASFGTQANEVYTFRCEEE